MSESRPRRDAATHAAPSGPVHLPRDPHPGGRPDGGVRSGGRVRRRALTVALAVVVVAAVGLGWRAWMTRAQGEPQAVEFTDAVLGPRLTGATVLALGEATHGNAEFQTLRTELARKLPQFRTIVLEEDVGSVALVDRFVQGGPGTAREAAMAFGFRLSKTEQVADFLQFLRDRNAALPTTERTHLVGMDVQRVDANKQIALDRLAASDPARAERLATELASLTDDHRTAADYRAVSAGLDELAAALGAGRATGEAAGTDAAGAQADAADRGALDTARALQQGRDLQQHETDYLPTRAQLMFANLERTVARSTADGAPHVLLFAHDGHVDKVSAAYRHADLGALAAQRWGDSYRVIGTDFVRTRFLAADGAGQRREFVIDHPTPLRGMFAGTRQGYLEFATAGPANADLLHRTVPMGSAGDSFTAWQAWLPPLVTVRTVPADGYDALVLVSDATPVTPL